MLHLQGKVPKLFDCCANPFDQLLLLGKDLHDLGLYN